jgi:hypothetical protein
MQSISTPSPLPPFHLHLKYPFDPSRESLISKSFSPKTYSPEVSGGGALGFLGLRDF